MIHIPIKAVHTMIAQDAFRFGIVPTSITCCCSATAATYNIGRQTAENYTSEGQSGRHWGARKPTLRLSKGPMSNNGSPLPVGRGVWRSLERQCQARLGHTVGTSFPKEGGQAPPLQSQA